jgi:hypothetical protein
MRRTLGRRCNECQNVRSVNETGWVQAVFVIDYSGQMKSVRNEKREEMKKAKGKTWSGNEWRISTAE